jgi:DNA polymerase III psi subunit
MDSSVDAEPNHVLKKLICNNLHLSNTLAVGCWRIPTLKASELSNIWIIGIDAVLGQSGLLVS